jgi:indole-3-glycerol phosphate synthase
MTILESIFQAKRLRVAETKQKADLPALREAALYARLQAQPRAFRAALASGAGPKIVAEFKRASPSKGVINESIEPETAAASYQRGGAAAISVLTEEDYFKGSLADLKRIRETVSLPILRKDFIFDEFQLLEAAAAGADAILLIVAGLPVSDLRSLRMIAEDEMGLGALVEVHTEEEMQIAKDVGATLIGVNNRDLRTFDVSLDVSRELVRFAPANTVLISESGLRSKADMLELATLGYSGFLIGETLMRSGDPEMTLRQLVGKAEAPRL